ncbi:MauE/DoxX family redox-associated membrane protein [Paenibacillus sp. E194]|uniref:MauE/DoxX family redox-associated membrane protein n=1 Tax=Paenibacillus sp. E194 TaxID=1458845 RepID=UPI003FA5C3A9
MYPTLTKKTSIYVLIGLELVFSVCHLSDFFSPWRQLLTIILLVFFIAILIYQKNIIGSTECSCFGKNNLLNKMPIVRNIILISICAISVFIERDSNVDTSTFNYLITLLLLTSTNLYQGIKIYKTMRDINGNIQ